MSVMQSGTQMVKLKAGSKGLVRLFYLDDHRSCIRWKPSRKSEKAKSEYAWVHHTYTPSVESERWRSNGRYQLES